MHRTSFVRLFAVYVRLSSSAIPAMWLKEDPSDAFAYVLDVVPTLLAYANVKTTTRESTAQPGNSMASVLAGKAKLIHPLDQPIGYESAGGAAVYLGNNKLVRSVPPYGNGKWRLYDIATDPTESKDLAASGDPALMQMMIADYAAYAKRSGVVDVPQDYDVMKQARANAAKKQ